MKIARLKVLRKRLKSLISKRLIALIPIIALGLFVLTRGSAKLSEIKTQTVTREDLTQQVIASGKTAPTNQSTLHFATAGKLVWFSVKEGDRVKKGQVIASLDREIYEIAIRQAEQDVLVADAQLAQVYDDISKASGAESLQNRIKRTTAEAAKNKAFDALKRAQRDIKNSQLAAPISGTVTKLDVNVGEEIFQTTEIATIKNTNVIDFIAEVDETDILKVQIGQTAAITLDSQPDTQIKSSVKSISPDAAVTTTGATAYRVKLEIPDNNPPLGANGQVTIDVAKVSSVLVVPIEAVIDDRFIWIKQDNSYRK